MIKTKSALAATLCALMAAGAVTALAPVAQAAPASTPTKASPLPVSKAAHAKNVKIIRKAVEATRSARPGSLATTPRGMALAPQAAKAAAVPGDITPAHLGFANDRVYGRGGNGRIYWRSTTPGANWIPFSSAVASGPSLLPASFEGEPLAALLFARGTNNNLVWNVHDDAQPDFGWESLGGNLTSAPTVDVDENGIHVVARGGDGAIWLRSWLAATGDWGAWSPLGGVSTSAPSIVAHPVLGRLVTTRGTNGAFYQRNANFGNAWAQLATPPVTSRPETQFAYTPEGTTLSYGWRGSDNALYLDTEGGNGPVKAGGNITSGATIYAYWSEGFFRETYVRGADNSVWRYVESGQGAPARWEALGGKFI